MITHYRCLLLAKFEIDTLYLTEEKKLLLIAKR